MSWLSFVYSLIKLIPIVDKAVRDFLIFYSVKQVEWFNAKVTKAVAKAIATGETSDLENSIGSPRAGKPSGNAGADFDDPDAH
jgi:hypothetical protein